MLPLEGVLAGYPRDDERGAKDQEFMIGGLPDVFKKVPFFFSCWRSMWGWLAGIGVALDWC